MMLRILGIVAAAVLAGAVTTTAQAQHTLRIGMVTIFYLVISLCM
jgi:hypothetical protein